MRRRTLLYIKGAESKVNRIGFYIRKEPLIAQRFFPKKEWIHRSVYLPTYLRQNGGVWSPMTVHWRNTQQYRSVIRPLRTLWLHSGTLSSLHDYYNIVIGEMIENSIGEKVNRIEVRAGADTIKDDDQNIFTNDHDMTNRAVIICLLQFVVVCCIVL